VGVGPEKENIGIRPGVGLLYRIGGSYNRASKAERSPAEKETNAVTKKRRRDS